MPTILLRATTGDRPSTVVLTETPELAGRVMECLDGARALGDHRGLSAFTGSWLAREVGVQTTGIGAPAMAMVTEELLMVGARRLLFLGEAILLGERRPEDLVFLPLAAAAADGTTRAYAKGEPVAPTANLDLVRDLADRLAAVPLVTATGMSVTLDVTPGEREREQWRARGAICADMALAPLFYLCRRPRTLASAAGALFTAGSADADPGDIPSTLISACLTALAGPNTEPSDTTAR